MNITIVARCAVTEQFFFCLSRWISQAKEPVNLKIVQRGQPQGLIGQLKLFNSNCKLIPVLPHKPWLFNDHEFIFCGSSIPELREIPMRLEAFSNATVFRYDHTDDHTTLCYFRKLNAQWVRPWFEQKHYSGAPSLIHNLLVAGTMLKLFERCVNETIFTTGVDLQVKR